MDLLLVRHGVAEDVAGVGRAADARRRLTPVGRRRMRAVAEGLEHLAPSLDVVASSPLQRAVETAEIVAERCGVPRVVELPALAPGASSEVLLSWLARQRRSAAIALVGHEPHLSRFACLLLGGVEEPFFGLRKGGACLLEVEGRPAPGAARLQWLATGSLLRALARARG